MRRRSFVAGAAAALGVPPFAAGLANAEEPRFALGIASGQPHASGMVLWTRVTGALLPARVPVVWEIADDERFERVVARGEETAEAAWAHSVHAEPNGLEGDRWYWYRFSALGQRSETGRTRTAPATDAAVARVRFAIASCQRYDAGHYAAWRHVSNADLDLVLFLGDYIYETPSRADAFRRHEGGELFTLAQYRARYATYKSDPSLRAAHAAMPWLMVWDDHEVSNDYADLNGQDPAVDMRMRRTAAYRAYWEHMPFPNAARPVGADMRIVGRTDWGTLARFHRLDDRQYRDPQVCPRPGRGGSNTVTRSECPDLLDPRRSLLGAEQERWLSEGWDLARPWNVLMQQTLMARFNWGDPARGGLYWTDGWDGYSPARQRLLADAARRKVPGLVVVGGDVHSNYVADLHVDADDPRSPVVASEFCGTSISSVSSLAQSRIDEALAVNPHIRFGRTDQRGIVRFELDRKQLRASLEVVDRPADPASSISIAARFVVDAGRPGPVAA